MYRFFLTAASIVALATLLLLSATSVASASLIASDDFESYNLGALSGQGAAGLGWSGAWGGIAGTSGSSAVARNVVAGAMTNFGQSMEVGFSTTGTGNNIVQRGFDAQTGTVYIGFLVKTTGFESGGNGDFFQLYANNASHTSTTLRADGTSPSGGIDFSDSGLGGAYVARKGRDYQTNSSLLHENDLIRQMVIRLSKTGSNGDNYDEVALFVNQGTEGTPDAARGAADPTSLTLTTLSQIHLRIYDFETGNRVYLDNLRIATTYAEAASIPEPAGFAMLLAGSAALALWARRRRK
jgi:hypothetical protein